MWGADCVHLCSGPLRPAVACLDSGRKWSPRPPHPLRSVTGHNTHTHTHTHTDCMFHCSTATRTQCTLHLCTAKQLSSPTHYLIIDLCMGGRGLGVICALWPSLTPALCPLTHLDPSPVPLTLLGLMENGLTTGRSLPIYYTNYFRYLFYLLPSVAMWSKCSGECRHLFLMAELRPWEIWQTSTFNHN